ncbi:hypothetical protein [Aequorivita antarctica]|uniref:Uncharacterized protein n=1 Tax=Aequorivita antarctica TaxID=153266 RepID=A0A5C6YZX7_9FLAO|nr:hypothetical protein [Aequorivita antarctica]TXD72775.1 hypothetical protein ESU54_11180 [Aequorivita antarctica]SRX76225.1 hypothetical protein AEQU3_03224 [Aequorivita antarctica]
MQIKSLYILSKESTFGFASESQPNDLLASLTIFHIATKQILQHEIDVFYNEWKSQKTIKGGAIWHLDSLDNYNAIWYNTKNQIEEDITLTAGSNSLNISKNTIVVQDGSKIILKSAKATSNSFSTYSSKAPLKISGDIVLHSNGHLQYEIQSSSGIIPYIRFFTENKDKNVIAMEAEVFVDMPPPLENPFVIFLPSLERGTVSILSGVTKTAIKTNFLTPLGSPLYLKMIGGSSGYSPVYDPKKKESYFTLQGTWGLVETEEETREPVRIICGISGIEFIQQPTDDHISFHSDRGAYGPYQLTDGEFLTATMPDAPYPVTTAWVSFPNMSANYYAQPEPSPLYGIDNEQGRFLKFLEIRTIALSSEGETPIFPLMPYHGVQQGELAQCERIEQVVLTPCRRDIILKNGLDLDALKGPESLSMQIPVSLSATGGMTGSIPVCPTGPFNGMTGMPGPTGPFISAVTPQGLLAKFDEDLESLETLTLAHSSDIEQTLVLTDVREEMRVALLTNQLFLVISSYEKFEQHEWFSVEFRLTQNSFEELAANDVPSCVLQPLRNIQNIRYFSKKYFKDALLAVLGRDPLEEYGDSIFKYGAAAILILGDWVFELAPYYWSDHDAVMVIKFSNLSLKELVADTGLWTLGSVFNDSVKNTQAQLQKIIKEAEEKVNTEPDFKHFSYTIVNDQSGPDGGTQLWNGSLFFNVTVPLNQLPPQLQGLAAGIKKDKFFAHHMGATVSSIDAIINDQIKTADSSLFGLIFYEDPGDLIYQGDPYAYKVLSLKVLFFNSQVTNFSSQIELLVGELFDELVTLPNGLHGNNIILNGSYQKHGSEESYLFIEESDNAFIVESQVLEVVEITKAQFITVLDSQSNGSSERVETKFMLWGSMQFKELEGFDMFSFGPESASEFIGQLAFSNLAIDMSFNKISTEDPQFIFNAGQMAFDISQSSARPKSLFNKFPLSISGLVQGSPTDDASNNDFDVRLVRSHEELQHFLYSGYTLGNIEASPENTSESPTDLGYMSMLTPLKQSKISSPWFGLVFDVNFGSPGGLAAKLNFKASLIAAWSPSKDNYQIFSGLKLPGSSGGNTEITIMGPLKLKMDRITLMPTQDEAYMMKFFNIALSFLGVKFPPGGRTNVLLFGDPAAQTNTMLGWYAAYKKDEEKKKESGDDKQEELSRLINQSKDS